MARIRISGRGAIYHCISRIVGEERLLGELEKEKLRHLLWHQAAFMKELKQRFSRWFNRMHHRFGTLCAERFKSLVVEDEPGAVAAVAAHIDLSPVWAGARPMRGLAALGHLMTLRELRVDAVG